MKTKLSIIIPVFNEVKTVGILLDQIKELKMKEIIKEIIVVDDFSNDGTSKLLKTYQKRDKFKLIHHSKNLGKGAAFKNGLKIATGDIILIQDGDLEYSVQDYPDLLKPIQNKKTKFVLGSRHLYTNNWKMRKFLDSIVYANLLNVGSVFYSKLINWIYRVNLTDPGTMYKVFKKDCLEGIEFKSNHFDIDWELVAKFIKKGYVPVEVPVSYKSRSPKEGKKIKLIKDGYRILKAIFRYRFVD